MDRIERSAPAKINLTLHVTGQRADGYHELDSLVVFADIGDRILARPADRLSLAVTGPEAAGLPAGEDNLVLRAARLMAGTLPADRATPGARLTLEKHLPTAAGIGGGSADAAATLRALAALWDRPLPDARAVLALGADLPVCLAGRPCRMTGIGETLAPLPPLPALDILLVNPRRPVSTPTVFRALARKSNPAMPATLPRWRDAADFAAWLAGQRNDLAAPAAALLPDIADMLQALRDCGCWHASMSGSGATCYGLCPPGQGTAHAARLRQITGPRGWWIAHGRLLEG